jgi:uncharacterized protein YraI
MRKHGFTLLLLLALLSACSPASTPEPITTASPIPSPLPSWTPPPPRLTFTPTLTPIPTLTVAPSPVPTLKPVSGVVRSPSNVRSGPGKGGNSRLGGVFFNQKVQVLGRNDAANWLYIVFADSPTGTGWVLGGAVTLKVDLGQLPIYIYPNGSDKPVMLPPLLYALTGTPLPLNPPPAGAKTATVLQMINVRTGPSVGFLTLGVLRPGAVVTLTGRIKDNYWAQIDYPSGLEGRAWISTDHIKLADGYGGLPFFNLLGTPVPANAVVESSPMPSPTRDSGTPPTPTETIGATGHAKVDVNVRGGPAQSFPLLGTLDAKELVLLTGRNLIGNWLQIEFPSGTRSRGWVATDYIDYSGVDLNKLPFYDNQGTPRP